MSKDGVNTEVLNRPKADEMLKFMREEFANRIAYSTIIDEIEALITQQDLLSDRALAEVIIQHIRKQPLKSEA